MVGLLRPLLGWSLRLLWLIRLLRSWLRWPLGFRLRVLRRTLRPALALRLWWTWASLRGTGPSRLLRPTFLVWIAFYRTLVGPGIASSWFSWPVIEILRRLISSGIIAILFKAFQTDLANQFHELRLSFNLFAAHYFYRLQFFYSDTLGVLQFYFLHPFNCQRVLFTAVR